MQKQWGPPTTSQTMDGQVPTRPTECRPWKSQTCPGRTREPSSRGGSVPTGRGWCSQTRSGFGFGVRLCTSPGGSSEDPEPGLGCRGGQGPTETAVTRTALGLLECNCQPTPAEINLGNSLGIPRELCRARRGQAGPAQGSERGCPGFPCHVQPGETAQTPMGQARPGVRHSQKLLGLSWHSG